MPLYAGYFRGYSLMKLLWFRCEPSTAGPCIWTFDCLSWAVFLDTAESLGGKSYWRKRALGTGLEIG